MPLTPEEAAALGLPNAQPAPKMLTAEESAALGLPASTTTRPFPGDRRYSVLGNLGAALTGAAKGISSGTGPISRLVRDSLIRPEELDQLGKNYEEAKAAAPMSTGIGNFAGEMFTPENAIAGEVAGAVLGSAARAMAPKIRGLAERAAVRSAMGDRTAYRHAFGKPANKEAVQKTGRFLLNETRLRSPAAMQDDLASIIASEGPSIGGMPKAAGQAGVTFDLERAALSALDDPRVAKLAADTEGRPTYTRIMEFLADQVKQHGNAVPPEAAHGLRMRLDQLAKWDKTRPDDVNKAWRAVRDAVSDELGSTMDRAGMGAAWKTANERFAQAKVAKGLADIGAERRAGNKLLQLGEWGAGIAGATSAAAHNPMGALAAGGIIAANRWGMPAAARTLDLVSRAPLQGVATPAGQVVAKATYPTLEEMLRRWTLGQAAAVAEDQGKE